MILKLGEVGISKFRAIGKTDGACFIKKGAEEKTTSNFMNVLHEPPVGLHGFLRMDDPWKKNLRLAIKWIYQGKCGVVNTRFCACSARMSRRYP